MKEDEDWLDTQQLVQWLEQIRFPLISMRRFPHSKWYKDDFLGSVKMIIGLMVLFSFAHPFINTVKMITTEKEKQLKVCISLLFLSYSLMGISYCYNLGVKHSGIVSIV